MKCLIVGLESTNFEFDLKITLTTEKKRNQILFRYFRMGLVTNRNFEARRKLTLSPNQCEFASRSKIYLICCISQVYLY